MTYGPFENTGVLTAPIHLERWGRTPFDLFTMMKDNDGWVYADRVDALANTLYNLATALSAADVPIDPHGNMAFWLERASKFLAFEKAEGVEDWKELFNFEEGGN